MLARAISADERAYEHGADQNKSHKDHKEQREYSQKLLPGSSIASGLAQAKTNDQHKEGQADSGFLSEQRKRERRKRQHKM